MTFDWSLSLGNLVTMGGFGLSGVVFVMMMRADLLVLGSRVSQVEAVLKTLTIAITQTAEMRGEINALSERVGSISHRLDLHLIHGKGDRV